MCRSHICTILKLARPIMFNDTYCRDLPLLPPLQGIENNLLAFSGKKLGSPFSQVHLGSALLSEYQLSAHSDVCHHNLVSDVLVIIPEKG